MINNIMVNKNVEWSGKVASKFALFELIFNKFILNFKDMGTSCVLYITNRNNDFIENMRIKKNNFKKKKKKKKKHVLNENEIIKLERNTLVKVILKDNHVYFRGYQFHYDINKKVYFEFVFVFDNIVIFLCDKILYILKNDKDIII